MTFSRLLHKQTLIVLGMNSGTSADGVDVAVMRISQRSGQVAWDYLHGFSRAYPKELRAQILDIADGGTVAVERLVRLDDAVGRFFGKVARNALSSLRRRRVRVDLIASHGQTVCHCPRLESVAGYRTRGSLQVGLPEQVAVASELPVISHFRQADIAVGNEGAPITFPAMARLFAERAESRLIVNLGGMANYFYFPGGRSDFPPDAADCGSGNSLSDILSRRLFREPFDRGGKHALSGKVSANLLDRLTGHPFFSGKRRSTGREEFGRELADDIVAYGRRHRLGKADLLATAGEFTVSAIARALKPIADRDRRLQKLYLTGGGIKNRFFRKRLRALFPDLAVTSIAELGVPPVMVESAAYAVLGEAALRSEPMETVIDRRRRKAIPILGRIIQPPVKR